MTREVNTLKRLDVIYFERLKNPYVMLSHAQLNVFLCPGSQKLLNFLNLEMDFGLDLRVIHIILTFKKFKMATSDVFTKLNINHFENVL